MDLRTIHQTRYKGRLRDERCHKEGQLRAKGKSPLEAKFIAREEYLVQLGGLSECVWLADAAYSFIGANLHFTRQHNVKLAEKIVRDAFLVLLATAYRMGGAAGARNSAMQLEALITEARLNGTQQGE